ncbi:MAG: NAD-glutamate dehydrogenase, partial [Gammaproteobacteria bacterium CG22_combo_CG10-13_8_21_14_all_40_8]
MSAQTLDRSSVLIDNVVEIIYSKLDKAQAKQVECFTRYFYGSIGVEDISNRLPGELYASILSLWNFIQKPLATGCKLRVLNPTLEEHGWQSKHTVIELLNNDMPFLVDSIRMELNRLGITTHFMIHLPLSFERDKAGKVLSVSRVMTDADSQNETPMYIEVDRQSNPDKLKLIHDSIVTVLQDVHTVVRDWKPMKKKLKEAIKELESSKANLSKGDLTESVAFLNWISNNHFTLMGYSAYDINAVGGEYELVTSQEDALGLQKHSTRGSRKLSSLPLGAQRLALDNQTPLIITKTSTRSTVHRPAYIDYIGVKRFDNKGNVIGEHRFLGLYTSEAYNISSKEIPVLRKKLAWVIERSGLTTNSHDIKALGNILETYPRDELFQVTPQELLETCIGILHMQERPLIKLFIRRDPYGRFFSCMVYVPREQYITRLRVKMMSILKEYLGGTGDVLFTTHFSESIHARTHYIVNVENAESVEYDVNTIEGELREAARSWNDNLLDALKSEFGEDHGTELGTKYENAFPAGYMAETNPATSVLDIRHMESLSEKSPLSMILYRPQETLSCDLSFKLFHLNKPAALSDVLPMLENMGLSVMEETPYRVSPEGDVVRFILDFDMVPKSKEEFELSEIKNNFQEAFFRVWIGEAENDGFNSLILTTGLNWREVSVLRAISKYLWQIGFTFTQSYIESTFSTHATLARMLVALFELKFHPEKSNMEEYQKAINSITTALTTVSNLDQDRIINRYVEFINALVRTNYYQTDVQGNFKPQLSFKLEPAKITGVPKPVPKYDIWVYSPRFEGVHLRSGPVARGGLRWSDRPEDFRTEVLGLVKAQQVKNSVIVPVGSKGGFVCKMMAGIIDREAYLAEGQECYRGFIRGMLDITDNIVEGEIVSPPAVVKYDGDDPYLVVAADKGTATFSDIANSISQEYGFWLDDAFASGGSQGYDHKKMGITAKGAWESTKRHFREMGIDCQKENFTCVGIGDMAGDVFGN